MHPLKLDHSYTNLPDIFYARLSPTPVTAPCLVLLNEKLAASLGIDPIFFRTDKGLALLAGNDVPENTFSIAQAYAGHQFGHFTMLGDGRAILLGELILPDNNRVDMQLKGSGRTPFSGSGDGRATLGPMLREYIISEAMHGLGIPTTRSLAVVTTGEPVMRETMLPGAILTRIAASHLRVGTFEYAAALQNPTALRVLADYAIQRHYYPTLADAENPYRAFLETVIDRQAQLIAQWMRVGFIHGVMNTDNMTISGETIDYGPCAFMDHYDPATVFSSIDRQGRYAYENQPRIAQWNLARFAETLLPLLDESSERAVAFAENTVQSFSALYERYWLAGMRSKLGLFNSEEEDRTLIETLLNWMHAHGADFTQTFHALSQPETALEDDASFQSWLRQWQARLARQPEPLEVSLVHMHAHNPFVIARNHQVETVLTAAVEQADFAPLHNLLSAIASPYEGNPRFSLFSRPPENKNSYKTFCGT